MTPGRIAAIVTCHNLGRTLVEALQSIERQTRPAAEILIVDGASTDVFTLHLMARLQRQGTRVVRTEQKGASAARNLGAQLTDSDYIVWLDADDVLEPGYFDAAAARLDADAGLSFVSCAMRAFGAASYVWAPSMPVFAEAIATGGVPHASTMMRRRLWLETGGFDESLPSFELLDFWATALERGADGIVLEEPLLRYRIRNDSGYRRSIERDVYLARLRHLYEKHRGAVQANGIELIERKEAFLVSQQDYCRGLESRRIALRAQLADLERQIADTVQELEAADAKKVDLGDLRRTEPLSPNWGFDRGTLIDRHYIERFLDTHRSDIRGRVLEVRDPAYTRRFGEAVSIADVLDIDGRNGLANVVADLQGAAGIPSSTYDCIILTQTLHLLKDMPAALRECERILKPGGVLLLTAPSTIRVDDEAGRDGDFWRLTEASALTLFADVFPLDAFEIEAHGNVMVCAAFLYGMAVEELSPGEVEHQDPNFPLVITVRAVKPPADVVRTFRSASAGLKACTTTAGTTNGVVQAFRPAGAVILAYHRIAELTPDAHHLCTPPHVFREHMQFLRERCHPMALDELLQAAARGEVPDRAVAVTLDDGYLDHLTTASPILSELGIPATFFVNTERIDEPHERWWDILEGVLAGEALDELNRAMWPMDAAGRERTLEAVLAERGVIRTARATHRVLTGDELCALADRPGHTIGAHTTHHLALTVQSADTKRREILENKAALERLLKRPVTLFSYPYGDFDAETVSAVNDARFHGAVTVQTGLVSAGTNRMLLPRYEVTPDYDGVVKIDRYLSAMSCAEPS